MAGRIREIKGSIKEAAGDLINNEQMEAEGKADRLGGKAEREAKGAKDSAVGTVKKGAGKVLGNEQLQAEGEAQRLKGKAQQAG